MKKTEKKRLIQFGLFRSRFLWKIVLLCWVLILLTIIVFLAVIIPLQKNTALDRMDNEARDIASTITIANSSALITGDYGLVVDYCVDLVKESHSIQYLVITRKDGYSMLFTKVSWEQKSLSGMWLPDTTRRTGRIVYSPLVKKSIYHKTVRFTYLGIYWGFTHVGLSLDNYQASVRKTAASMMWATILMACIGFVMSVYFAQKITNPIRILDQTARRIAKGNLNARADIHTGDEHESLAASFNTMTDSLRAERENLEAKVKERTSLLQEMNVELAKEITERRKMEESLEKHMKQLEGLQEIYRGIIAAKSINEIVLETFRHLSGQMSEFDAAYLVLYDNGKEGSVVHQFDPHGPSLKPIEWESIVLTGGDEQTTGPDIRIENDLSAKNKPDRIETALLNLKARSCVRSMLRFKDKTVGQCIFTSLSRRQFTDGDAMIVSQISEQLAVAFAQFRLQEDLRTQAAVLQKSLKEKEVLLKEIHHRVKNNLQIISSLLNLQSRKLNDERIITVFKDSQARVRSMALVHEKLYRSKDLSNVDLREYILNLSDFIKGTYSHRNVPVRFAYDLEDVLLPIDIVIPMGLILNELVSNALKHAFVSPGFDENKDKVITIQLKRQGDQHLVIGVKDNGVGLPEGMDVTSTDSLGLKLVSMLSKQIRGKLQVSSENGAQFTVTVPI